MSEATVELGQCVLLTVCCTSDYDNHQSHTHFSKSDIKATGHFKTKGSS